MTMTPEQIEGITKARLAANIAAKAMAYATDADYIAHVYGQAGLDALPETAADSYAAQWAGETVEALETRLAEALAEAVDKPTPPEPVIPTDPVGAAKARAEAIFVAKCVTKSPAAVCATPAGIVQCDEASRGLITGAVVTAMCATQAGQPFSVVWTLADNTHVTLDAPGMIGMGMAVSRYVAQCHYHKVQLKAAIDAGDAPELEVGWP